jgi:hypothetical protein
MRSGLKSNRVEGRKTARKCCGGYSLLRTWKAFIASVVSLRFLSGACFGNGPLPG